jgi:hypothetical protein
MINLWKFISKLKQKAVIKNERWLKKPIFDLINDKSADYMIIEDQKNKEKE